MNVQNRRGNCSKEQILQEMRVGYNARLFFRLGTMCLSVFEKEREVIRYYIDPQIAITVILKSRTGMFLRKEGDL